MRISSEVTIGVVRVRDANRTVRVQSVVHPQPNAFKMTQALIALAKQLTGQERREQQEDKEAA